MPWNVTFHSSETICLRLIFFFKIENSRKLELEKFQNHKFAKIEARENYQIYSMMIIHV